MSSTNVHAEAVATLHWLATPATTLAVPVYQRQYRWTIEQCRRLLDDLCAVAKSGEGQSHFLGSILFTASGSGEETEWMLVDGQQRVTTLMLLIAAIRDNFAATDAETARALHHLLAHPSGDGRTRLRLRKSGEQAFADIVFGGISPREQAAKSQLHENHDFFVREIRDIAREVWIGMQRVEHVAITLRGDVNPQQVFESLNATGTPLRDHELIHNYVLMGLSGDEQSEIEDAYWIPVEEYTGEAIDGFLRDYLILRTGRDSQFTGEHGVYAAFKQEFPAPRYPSLPEHAAEWRAYAEVYSILLAPTRCPDHEIARQLMYCNTFGTTMYPILLGVYHDYLCDRIDRTSLLALLEELQALYLRKMVVGESRDHLAAQLCRKKRQYGYPIREIARRTPADERIRAALKHTPLPHAGYVLRRLEEPFRLDDLGDLQIEHIFPQFPGDTWSGGTAEWSTFSELERAAYREVLSAIGNLALLESGLNAAASNKPFQAKVSYYAASEVPSTRLLARTPVWDLESIAERTQALTERFLEIWRRPAIAGSDVHDHLVPILDVQRKPGYYRGWKTEFAYVVFHGEIWEVRNTKELFERTFRRLWETRRGDVLQYSGVHDGPVFASQAWNGRWQRLGDHYLFMGLFPQYMLAAVQGILDELDMADDVYVSYESEDEGPHPSA